MLADNKKKALLFLIIMLLIDRFFFGFIIWRIPNESPWGTNHFFNFLYEKMSIERTKKSKFRVLILGSSIAYYSLDSSSLEGYLRDKTKNEFEVRYLAYAGMTPLDAFLLKDDIESINPDLVIYPLNFIDYRLHRAYVLDPNGKNETMDDQILLLDALNFGDAPQSKFTFPEKAIQEFLSELPLEKISSYASSTLFLFYRYREIFSENLRNLYNHRFGRNTRYHGYAGVQIPERVNSLGWTSRKFSFLPKQYMFEKGFWIQIVPEILSKGPLVVTFRAGQETESISINSTGWKKLKLSAKFQNHNQMITAELSKIWHPYLASQDRFDHSRDEMGVRLQQTFGLDSPLADYQYVREERSEDLRYINMNEKEYEEYFQYRLLSDFEHRPGIRYIHALKNAKLRLTGETFRPTLHFQFLKKFTESMKEKKIPILLINNPENPLALKWYEKSKWYEDHLDFLKSLRFENEIEFIDFRDKLNMQDFSDFHHFTFPGMIKMNESYGDVIVEFTQKKDSN